MRNVECGMRNADVGTPTAKPPTPGNTGGNGLITWSSAFTRSGHLDNLRRPNRLKAGLQALSLPPHRDLEAVRRIRNELERRGHNPLLFFLKCQDLSPSPPKVPPLSSGREWERRVWGERANPHWTTRACLLGVPRSRGPAARARPGSLKAGLQTLAWHIRWLRE